MAFLQQRLAAAGSRGMFMQVDPRNLGALRFYETIGLQAPEMPTHSVYVVKRLA